MTMRRTAKRLFRPGALAPRLIPAPPPAAAAARFSNEKTLKFNSTVMSDRMAAASSLPPCLWLQGIVLLFPPFPSFSFVFGPSINLFELPPLHCDVHYCRNPAALWCILQISHIIFLKMICCILDNHPKSRWEAALGIPRPLFYSALPTQHSPLSRGPG